MQEIRSKAAGFEDWLMPEEGRLEMDRNTRQIRIQEAINGLSEYQGEPEIGQIIVRLRELMG